jgi:uncharacterized membrane protein YqjE
MVKQIALLAVTVVFCMGLCIIAVMSIQELFLCDGSYQYKSIIWLVAALSSLGTIACAYSVWMVCNNILMRSSNNKPKPETEQ